MDSLSYGGFFGAYLEVAKVLPNWGLQAQETVLEMQP